MKKSKIVCPSDRSPIWLSNWIIGYTGGRGGKIENCEVNNVVVKGEDEKAILKNKGALRKAVWAYEGTKIQTKVTRNKADEMVGKYIPISVELIKQIGFGIKEDA